MKSSFEMFRLAAHRRKCCGGLVCKDLRRHPGLLRGSLDLLAALVGAGHGEHIVTEQAS